MHMGYRFIQRTIQVRTQVHRASRSACSCTMRELKMVNKRPMYEVIASVAEWA